MSTEVSKIVLVSTKVLWDESKNAPQPGSVSALQECENAGSRIALVSRHPRPGWLKTFGEKVLFQQHSKRGDGTVVQRLIDANKDKVPGLNLSHFIVVGARDEDMFMAANARALLIQPGWVRDRDEGMKRYGVPLKVPADLPRVVELLRDKSPWFFYSADAFLDVYSLTDASTLGPLSDQMKGLADSLRRHLKTEEELLRGVLLHLLSSVYATDSLIDAKLWSFYPGSERGSADGDLLAKLTHRVREPLKTRNAARGEPLFVRHADAPKRHVVGGNRTDPTSQLQTLHLNPKYKTKIRGSTVAVVDDFLTYGCSFAVAAALLKAAGAKKVLAVAMGKFGGAARRYDIEVTVDPFQPLPSTGYRVGANTLMSGVQTKEAQLQFFEKFGRDVSSFDGD